MFESVDQWQAVNGTMAKETPLEFTYCHNRHLNPFSMDIC